MGLGVPKFVGLMMQDKGYLKSIECLNGVCWRYSNGALKYGLEFIIGILDGYPEPKVYMKTGIIKVYNECILGIVWKVYEL